MGNDIELNLHIGWWNTSLTPQRRRAPNQAEKSFAFEMVKHLITKIKVDCLGLAEICHNDLDELTTYCNSSDYNFIHANSTEDRLKFDTGLIYNKRIINILKSTNIKSSDGHHTLKLAQKIDFKINYTDELLHLYLLHWPSRLWFHEKSSIRNLFGIRLRDSIDNFVSTCVNDPQILIVGDFNDEPFDEPLAKCLKATRDRTLVKNDPSLLYNPFWRHLGETIPYSAEHDSDSICGTCFHRTGEETKWRTFDQIIVSPSLLTNDHWHFNEEKTVVFHSPQFDEAIRNGNSIFDHRPIVSVIQRIIKPSP